jgi:hypothetical protein
MPEGEMTLHSHKVAFYADIFYNSELSPAYWIPPANLDVEAILLGGDIQPGPPPVPGGHGGRSQGRVP